MADPRWERLAAATGIVFVVLVVAAVVLGGRVPTPADPTEDVVSYYLDKRGAVLAQGYLLGLAAVFFLWFLGSLRSFLRRAEGETGRLSAVAFAGGIITLVLVLVGVAVLSALAFTVAETADPEITRALFDVGIQMFNLRWFAVSVFTGAAAVVIIRTNAMPLWMGWLGGLVAVGSPVAGFGMFIESGPLAAGGAFGYLVFVLFFLWVLLASIQLVQRVREREA